jgi:Cu-processing system permease protein
MTHKILIVAAKEWRDGWRNRWLIAITLIFAIMALGLTWFGSVTYGQTGPSPIDSTIASLASLAVLVIPLIALLLGYDAFVGEQEAGTLLLLMAYPISKLQLILGKFLGQLAILAVSTTVGFGSAAVVLSLQSFSIELLISFAVFIFSATLLGAVFLAMSQMVSLSVSEKTRAAGLALFIWFFFTLLYDLGLLAVLVSSEGWMSQTALKFALLANPTDVFRLINLIHLDAQGSGPLASVQQFNLNAIALYGLLCIWIGGCLLSTKLLFIKKKI